MQKMDLKKVRRSVLQFEVAMSALACSLGLAAIPGAAHAQVAPKPAPDDAVVEDKDIVVTGTILRGAAPVGSNLISVGQERIVETGATTANELLASVPQITNLFNNVPTARLGVAVNQIQVVRPNIRNLAGETSSSASTLVLFDGHRISPVGVTQNAVDPDIIPPIAIERVEVVTDGGSATYGSDAVGGVINFITRKRFDGVKVEAKYGFADNYYQVDAGAIVGKDWGTGSVFAAYNYQHNDALFGRDRGFIRDVDFLRADLLPRGRSCTPGNVTIGANLFALPALTSTTPNACDNSDDNSVVPQSTRNSAIVGLHQELASWLTADLRAFYGQREATSFSPFRGSATVTSAQAFYRPVPGQNATANQNVLFSLAPLLGQNSVRSSAKFKEGGVNAEFKADLNDNWSLRTLLNYSSSTSQFHIPGFSPGLLTSFARGTTAATAINFYAPGSGTNDAANIAQLINNENTAQGKQSLFDARAIVDGTLFSWAGGDIKLAAGYEHIHDRFQQRVSTSGVIGTVNALPYTQYDRSIDSAFGEIQIPIVGADNRASFIYSLTLAGSVRYDDFSDFGNTTNPKIGVNFKPTEWLGFRGNYSTSFNAPSPVDQLGGLRNSFFGGGFVPFNAFVRPGDVPTVNGLIAIQGSNPGLTPQTAKTYSFGIDIDPPFLEGLRVSANYYNVKFKNIIGQPTPNAGIFANFPNNVVSNVNGVSIDQVTTFLNGSGVSNSAQVLASTLANNCNQTTRVCGIYELIDFRQGNYGSVKVDGIDFSANYRTATGFGGIDAGISGNYVLNRISQTGVGAPIIDDLNPNFRRLQPGNTIISTNGQSRLTLSASVGADIGNFRAQATLNHTGGFGVTRCDTTTTATLVCNPSATGVATAAGLPQDRVKAFNTVNLFFKYDVPSDSALLKDLSFTVNINNVFDTNPPIFRSIGNSQPGYANGFTLGRLIQFGISKKF